MHECLHEADLAVTKEATADIKDDIKQIKDAIVGNEHPGLKTDVAILKRQMVWIWALVSIETAAIVTAAFKSFGG